MQALGLKWRGVYRTVELTAALMSEVPKARIDIGRVLHYDVDGQVSAYKKDK